VNAPCSVIIVPVPAAGSPGWAKVTRPGYPQRNASAKRAPPWREQAIPSPCVDRDVVRRLAELGRRHVAERRATIEAMLAA
jgi:hypothetical protein